MKGHVRTKEARKRLAERFKDPEDDFRLVIVVDMWLTGFDVPCAHTMYLDKPLAGHNLMQAIARVNRVYGEKPGGLIVDMLGLADQFADALATYAQASGKDEEAFKKVQDEAVPAMQSAFEKLRGFFHGFDYSAVLARTAAGGVERLRRGHRLRARPARRKWGRCVRRGFAPREPRTPTASQACKGAFGRICPSSPARGDGRDRSAFGVFPTARRDDAKTPGR